MATHRRHCSGQNMDRFIPNRSAMGLGSDRCMLTQSNKDDFASSWLPDSLSRETYKEKLAEALGVSRTRMLTFNKKRSTWKEPLSPTLPCKSFKPLRDIPLRPKATSGVIYINPNFSLNLVDWGSCNIFCIGIKNIVALWNPSSKLSSELIKAIDIHGRITSVSWAPDGRQLAIALNNSNVQLWDPSTAKLLRTFREGHTGRVGSLAWNNHILTSGGHDAQIINKDVRIKSYNVSAYHGHSQEIYGLKWSDSGERLASGGEDKLIHIWDRSMASSATQKQKQWLHRLAGHNGKVRAIAWCPYKINVLASGGDESEKCIKFWNTSIGRCVNTMNTGSQVSALLWNKNEHNELLSSHGSSQNQLTLWKYPCMTKMAELTGHESGVISMAESPNGVTVASASADHSICFWDVFGNSRQKRRTHCVPFANNFNYIR